MYIIIVGAGEVGTYLARILIAEQHSVAIVERDEAIVREIESSLDALIVLGSGVDQDALAQAGLSKADLVLAVTEIDEVNLITCMVAGRLGRSVKTVARVRGSEYFVSRSTLKAQDLGLSLLVGPERAVASKVVRLLEYEGAGARLALVENKLALLEMPLGEDSPFVHESLSELTEVLGPQSLVCAVYGDDGLKIPTGSDRLKTGERAYILTLPENQDMFMILSGKPWHHVRHILIIGGGTIGFHLARELEKHGYAPTIIEKDAARAEWISNELSKSDVLHGDGTDPEFLKAELQEQADAVVVLLDDSEKAIIVGLFAKQQGAKKVIVRSDKSAYAPLAHKLGIDALISPHRAVADAILQFVHKGGVASHMLAEHEGEIMQLKVSAGANKVIGKSLSEIDFPSNSLVGAVIREGQPAIAKGSTVLQAGDELLIIALPDAISKVDKLLS
jgi:trk system potassium uptake protein